MYIVPTDTSVKDIEGPDAVAKHTVITVCLHARTRNVAKKLLSVGNNLSDRLGHLCDSH